MSALPISAAQIHSNLLFLHGTENLPPNLLSSQLAFRHSCLNLTADDPAYFFWPSSDDQHVLDALEAFRRKPIDDISLEFDIQYTRDDSFFAHVQVTPGGLRIVFIWEDETWRYHNAAHMPFPPNSYASLHSVPEPQAADEDSGSAEEDADTYWDSYGEPAGEDNTAEEKVEADEKSYWDMYNSVQGSGDSVIPSPVPEKQQQQQDVYSNIDGQPTDLDSLSDRLAAISRRPPLEEDAITNDMDPATDPLDTFSDRLAAISQRPPLEEEDAITVVDPSPTKRDSPGVDALKESVRGLYRLWKVTSVETDPELFLSIVRETVTEMK